MSEIKRRDPLVSEAIDILDNHLQRCNYDIAVAWNTLSSVYTDFINDELAKCMQSPRYYLENYHVIKSEYEGFKTLYPFWDSQEIFYTEVITLILQGKPVKVLVLKARQLGMSELAEGIIFWRTIFNETITTLIVAQDVEQADYLFTKSMRAYENLPWWLKPEKRYGSKGRYLVLDANSPERKGLGSEIIVAAANKTAGAAIGKTIRCAHLSELSAWGNAKVLTEQIFPTMNAPDTISILESTARGRKGFWYDFWNEAERKWGTDPTWQWKPIFIEWFRCPQKYSLPIQDKAKFYLSPDEMTFREKVIKEKQFFVPDEMFNWKRMKVNEFSGIAGDEFGFMQEFPSNPAESFQSSGICAFPKKKLHQLMQTGCAPPKWFGEISYTHGAPQEIKTRLTQNYDNDGNYLFGPDGQRLTVPSAETYGGRLRVWEKPEKGESYYLGADVAYGIEGRGDFSCAQILRIGRGSAPDVQVAEWRGWINPTPFGHIVVGLAKWYNNCEVAIETNEVGTKTYVEVFRILQYQNMYRWKHYDKIKNFLTDFMGWVTTGKNRPLLITNLTERLIENTVRLYSYDLLNELVDFGAEEEGDKMEGQTGHDDRAMALMIALWCAHDSDYGKQAAMSARPNGVGMQMSFVIDQFGRIVQQCNSRQEAENCLVWIDDKGNRRIRAGWSIATRALKENFHNSEYSPVFDRSGPRQRLHQTFGVPTEQIGLDSLIEPNAAETDTDWRSY